MTLLNLFLKYLKIIFTTIFSSFDRGIESLTNTFAFDFDVFLTSITCKKSNTFQNNVRYLNMNTLVTCTKVVIVNLFIIPVELVNLFTGL